MTHLPPNDSQPGYEPAGVSVRVPVFLTLGLTGLIGGALLGLWALVHLWSSSQKAASPVTKNPPRQFSPHNAPLSARQRQERLDYEAEQQALLSSYGWIDREAEIARIPLARAFELMQQEVTKP